MACEPAFMLRFEEFVAERRRVRTLEDWRAFATRWFDTSAWPIKSPEQRAAEALRKQGPVRLGGRLWGYTTWVYDLSPEARYEYFSTLRRVGDPIRFGAVDPDSGERRAQECPYCEISTDEPGEAVCPRCGRDLVYETYAS